MEKYKTSLGRMSELIDFSFAQLIDIGNDKDWSIMIHFLHLADLHLGAKTSYLGSRATERGRDFLEAFKRAVDFAIREEIDFLVIAGDFFDTPNPSDETLRFAIAELKKLYQANIPVILTPGNHDAIGMPGSVYTDPNSEIRRLVNFVDTPNPRHVATEIIHGELVHFYSMAWDFQRSKPPFDDFHALDEPGYHIAVLHGTLEEGRFTDVHSREVPLKLSNLSETCMDYIALGHIHAPQEHAAGPIPVVYPGTLEGKRFTPGEEGTRSLVVVTLDGKARPQIERIPWNQRILLSAEINLSEEAVESDDDVVAIICDSYGDPNKLLRIKFTGTPPFFLDVDKLYERLSGDLYWIDIRDDTDVFDSRLIDEWGQEETIRGLLVRKLRDRMVSIEGEEARQKVELAMKLAIQALQKSVER